VVKQYHSPDVQEAKEREKGVGVPPTPSRAHPRDLKTSYQEPSFKSSTTSKWHQAEASPLTHGPLGDIPDPTITTANGGHGISP
jgi:hypothetical protein